MVKKSDQVKRRDLRLMWNSNGVWTNSGYGVESRDILFRLAKDGWPTSHIAFWGLNGYPIEIDGGQFKDEWLNTKIKVYPNMDNPHGSDALIAHGIEDKSNVIFTMQDVWTLDPQHLKQLKYWVPYVPIDKDPVPPGVLQALSYAYKIVTFSKWGQKVLEKHGFTSTLILEGTDTEVFKPMDKMQARTDLGISQDLFIFGMVAANKENPPRKGFQEALEAFRKFYDNHPEAAMLIHTQQRAPGSFPVEEYAKHLGFQDRLLLIQPYQAVFNSDSKKIAKEMNAMDVLLHPSQTEGFGLTCIEAMSCGVPVIVNNTTSMPEMVIDNVTGAICEPVEKGRWTSDNSFVYPADVDSLHDAMERTYRMVKENKQKVTKDCRDHIVTNYSIDTIIKNQWIPMLEELQEEIIPLQANPEEVKLNQLNSTPS